MQSRVSDPSFAVHDARAMAAHLAQATPQQAIAWAMDEFGSDFCIAFSGTDAVLVDMASRIQGDVDVVFVDTGHHFADTLWMRDHIRERYGVRVVTASSPQAVHEQEREHGPDLFRRDPDLCCWLRKVEPFDEALSGYRAWASGIRRDESPHRARTEVVEWDAGRGMVKVNPLAYWTQRQVEEYIARHDVPVNPLQERGYPSIGCAPCTLPVRPGESARSGRWVSLNKSECGLHVPQTRG